MQALGINLPATGNPAIPIVRADSLINAGTLLLIDPTHQANPWPAGVPANGAQLPNIAWQEARVLCGGGDALSLGVTFDNFAQAADAKVERTAKGGLHVICSQVNSPNANRGAALRASNQIRDYIFNNRAHRFAVAQIKRRTRLALTTDGQAPRAMTIGHKTEQYLFMALFDTNSPNGNQQTDSRASAGGNGLGNQISDVDATGFNADPASAADVLVAPMLWGAYGPGANYWANKGASDVFYLSLLEDLTVSGLSYAQFDAKVLARYGQLVVGAGRYASDTFTNPTSFP